jgi:hypothetical protein
MTLAATNCRSKNIGVLAVIVSELKLSDIERHVLAADLVERPDDTALEYRPEALNRVRVDRADNIFMRGVIDDFVLRKNLIEVLIANPMIGNQEADFVRDGLAYKTGESRGADVLDHTGDNATFATDRTSDDGLARSGAASAVTTTPIMPVLCFAADESFINFDNASEFFKIPVSECRADAVTHVPSSFVRAEAHEAVNLKGAHALLAGQHQVDHAEPVAKRFIRVLKDRPGDVGKAIALGGAFLALPMPFAGRQVVDGFIATTRASNPIRPAPRDQIGPTSIFIREHPLELSSGKLMNGPRFLSHDTPPTMEGIYHG